MRECDGIQREIASTCGKIPEKAKAHLAQCDACRAFLDDVLSLKTLGEKSRMAAPARLKTTLADIELEGRSTKPELVIGITAMAAVLAMVLMLFNTTIESPAAPVSPPASPIEKLDLVAGFNELDNLAEPLKRDEESFYGGLQPVEALFVQNSSGDEHLPEIYSAIDEYFVSNITPDIYGERR